MLDIRKKAQQIVGAAPSPWIRGVVFDLDGTLYTARFLGLVIAAGMLTELGPLRRVFRVRRSERSTTYENERALKEGFGRALAAETGMTPEAALTWYEDRFMPRFVHALRKRGRLRPKLPELLRTLGDRGVKTAVVSDFGLVRERLDAIGLGSAVFDDVVAAEALGAMKPSSRPFIHLAEKWRLPPDAVLLVGDRQDHDAASAALSGARFIGVAGGKRAGPDFLPWPEVAARIEELTRPRPGGEVPENDQSGAALRPSGSA